jgi:hypothetical protein
MILSCVRITIKLTGGSGAQWNPRQVQSLLGFFLSFYS